MAKDDKKDDAGRNEVPTEKLTTSDRWDFWVNFSDQLVDYKRYLIFW